jgi:hypothetical protein
VKKTILDELRAVTLPDRVPGLRRFGEFDIDDVTAAKLLKIARATIDRRLKFERVKLDPRGRSHTKPGSLLKDSIPMRTYECDHDAGGQGNRSEQNQSTCRHANTGKRAWRRHQGFA